MENVTGLRFLGFMVSDDLVIYVCEWEVDPRSVLTTRNEIKIAIRVEVAGVRRIATTSSAGRGRRGI